MDESVRTLSERRLVWGAYLASAALLVLFWEPIVWGRITTARYHNFDLGIYGQAIYLLSPADPNPWLTVRETKIFNDHFDPILWVAALPGKLLEPAFAGPLVELLFVLASPLAVVGLWKRGLLAADATALATFYMLCGRGTINAITFPFHPTTWAILPMAMLAAAILADRRWLVIGALVVLFACKQEFPLVGLAAAAIYAWRREFRFAVAVGALSLAWLLAVMYLRPLLLGDVTDYVAVRLIDAAGPWATFVRSWNGIAWRNVGQYLGPLVPLAVWLAWRRERAALWLWLLLVPPLALRFLGRGWGYHYIAVMAPPLVLGVMPLGPERRLPRAVVVATVVLIFAMNTQLWLRSAGSLAFERPPSNEPWTAARLDALSRGYDYLLTHTEGKALAQGNLVPRLVTRREIYQIAGSHNPAAHTFRYVFMEKPPRGEVWPVTAGDLSRLLSQWRASPGVQVIIDDEHVFLAEGEFRDLPRP